MRSLKTKGRITSSIVTVPSNATHTSLVAAKERPNLHPSPKRKNASSWKRGKRSERLRSAKLSYNEHLIPPTRTASVSRARKPVTRVHSVTSINYTPVSSQALHPTSPERTKWSPQSSMPDNISSKFSHSPTLTPLRSMLFAVPRHVCKLLPDP